MGCSTVVADVPPPAAPTLDHSQSERARAHAAKTRNTTYWNAPPGAKPPLWAKMPALATTATSEYNAPLPHNHCGMAFERIPAIDTPATNTAIGIQMNVNERSLMSNSARATGAPMSSGAVTRYARLVLMRPATSPTPIAATPPPKLIVASRGW